MPGTRASERRLAGQLAKLRDDELLAVVNQALQEKAQHSTTAEPSTHPVKENPMPPISERDRQRLADNGRQHVYDPVLARACELFDANRSEFDRLPASVKSRADVYRDFRSARHAAIAAGVPVPGHQPDDPTT